MNVVASDYGNAVDDELASKAGADDAVIVVDTNQH